MHCAQLPAACACTHLQEPKRSCLPCLTLCIRPTIWHTSHVGADARQHAVTCCIESLASPLQSDCSVHACELWA